MVVAGKRFLLHQVEFVVVVRADVVEEAHAALMLVEELIVGRDGRQMLYLVSVHLRHALRGVVVVVVVVVDTVFGVLRILLSRLIDEESLVLAPHLVVEEVLFAVFGNDNLQLRGVAASEDAVAAQDEVLRAES